VLFRKDLWDKLADGSVTVAIRRQKRPTVRAGGTLQSPAGQLAIDDPRVDLRAQDDFDPAEVAALGRSVSRMPYGAAILR
jgi:hypothetical protein